MNLWDAPFRKILRVQDLNALEVDTQQVLTHLGLDAGEIVEKMHIAPLGDPVSLRIGQHLFTLRSEVCRKIQVEIA